MWISASGYHGYRWASESTNNIHFLGAAGEGVGFHDEMRNVWLVGNGGIGRYGGFSSLGTAIDDYFID